jgi:hypothetical protein
MATIERALQIAAKAHEGQKDKEGQPYILHSIRVMMGASGDESQIVGVLHDVVEDTAVTLADLRVAGFSEAILAAVHCVTHEKNDPYSDYVIRCKANPIAKEVKLSDLRDNSHLDRSIVRANRIDRDIARLRRYFLSYKFLTDQLTEADYRLLMDGVG